mmetsp:Transcript_103291/g.267089  ORF Transcript_103291/g.267089 Transcript_103291/m.267089 type:complete len:226 (+) Transcript_103291:340-1017(+)
MAQVAHDVGVSQGSTDLQLDLQPREQLPVMLTGLLKLCLLHSEDAAVSPVQRPVDSPVRAASEAATLSPAQVFVVAGLEALAGDGATDSARAAHGPAARGDARGTAVAVGTDARRACRGGAAGGAHTVLKVVQLHLASHGPVRGHLLGRAEDGRPLGRAEDGPQRRASHRAGRRELRHEVGHLRGRPGLALARTALAEVHVASTAAELIRVLALEVFVAGGGNGR